MRSGLFAFGDMIIIHALTYTYFSIASHSFCVLSVLMRTCHFTHTWANDHIKSPCTHIHIYYHTNAHTMMRLSFLLCFLGCWWGYASAAIERASKCWFQRPCANWLTPSRWYVSMYFLLSVRACVRAFLWMRCLCVRVGYCCCCSSMCGFVRALGLVN